MTTEANPTEEAEQQSEYADNDGDPKRHSSVPALVAVVP